MTKEERIRIGEFWLGLASMYGREITKPALTIMLNAVEDLPYAKVLSALEDWSREPNHKSHPLPGDIRAKINPTVEDRDVAVELARKIDRCALKFGSYWEQGYFSGEGTYWNDILGGTHWSFEAAVKASIGEIGWSVVVARGGWANIVRSADEMDEGQFIAQLRDQVQSTLAMSRAGVDLARLGLPTPENPKLGLPDQHKVLVGLLEKAIKPMPTGETNQ